MDLRLHHLEPASRANGPGLRAVVWVQGCTLGCPGCFNPETHANGAGMTWAVDDLAAHLISLPGIEGVTLSGGEPLQQRPAVEAFMHAIKAASTLSILLFTGFRWDEIQRMPQADRLLAPVDVLLAGRYDATQRVADRLIGSANKTLHFLSPRYTRADLQSVPQAEAIILPDGEVRFSGIDPLTWGPEC
jgi:anaerobic ribonucleoside-triphosphate reductase activating protein